MWKTAPSKLCLSVSLSVGTAAEKVEEVNFWGKYKAAEPFLVHDLRLMERKRVSASIMVLEEAHGDETAYRILFFM